MCKKKCTFVPDFYSICKEKKSLSMKKYIFISLLALVGVMFSSCRSNEPQMRKKTIDLAVTQSKWGYDSSVDMFYCHFDVPEITSKVYNYGEFSVNREYNSGTPRAYQVALPETTYLQEEVDDGHGTISVINYQQHLDYAIGVGFVEVFCTISDFYYEGFSPDAMLFRLQMTY